MPEIEIRGIPVKFPYEPYDLQKEYMSKVIECLQTVSKTNKNIWLWEELGPQHFCKHKSYSYILCHASNKMFKKKVLENLKTHEIREYDYTVEGNVWTKKM